VRAQEDWGALPGVTDAQGRVLQQEKNSGQMRWAPDISGVQPVKQPNDDKSDTIKVTRVVNGVPHEVLVHGRTGEDIKDEGQTKVPGESPDAKRTASEIAQVELVGSEFNPRAKAEADAKKAEAAPKPKGVGGRLKAAADRLRGKKDDSGEGGKKASAKPSKGVRKKSTTPRKAGGS
jgi:hypothetical protein